eukprot:TRINITY_DN2892_c2_g1_i14.p1 TRINITY_DN2892_c2_g1~~TRINITY_DN2892_c2_g1_i14.p1  ORF type:complete len:115 (-),score=12.36 TRINITY_DN2892_c2_g1_i14:9-353(-)
MEQQSHQIQQPRQHKHNLYFLNIITNRILCNCLTNDHKTLLKDIEVIDRTASTSLSRLLHSNHDSKILLLGGWWPDNIPINNQTHPQYYNILDVEKLAKPKPCPIRRISVSKYT